MLLLMPGRYAHWMVMGWCRILMAEALTGYRASIYSLSLATRQHVGHMITTAFSQILATKMLRAPWFRAASIRDGAINMLHFATAILGALMIFLLLATTLIAVLPLSFALPLWYWYAFDADILSCADISATLRHCGYFAIMIMRAIFINDIWCYWHYDSRRYAARPGYIRYLVRKILRRHHLFATAPHLRWILPFLWL